MAKFYVPTELGPHVARSNGGLFPPHTSFEFVKANANDRPSLKLIPLDAEAYGLLVDGYGKKKVKAAHGEGPAPIDQLEAPVAAKPEPSKREAIEATAPVAAKDADEPTPGPSARASDSN